MARTKTITSFTLYFADKGELDKALKIADSEKWQAGHETSGDFTTVEFWFDNITPDRLSEFINEINN